jgi:hypothetical protein
MAVEVTGVEGSVDNYPDATKWHIDEERQLHIVRAGDSGNLAAYGTGFWSRVREVAGRQNTPS